MKLLKSKFKYYIFAGILIIALGILWILKDSNTKTALKNFGQKPKTHTDKKGSSKKNNEQNSDAEIYVQAFTAKTVEFKDELKDIVGTVKSSSLEIKSLQEERLLKFNFKPGDKVKKGAVIVELDHTRTKARLEQTKVEYDKKKMLFEFGGISKNELIQAKAALDIAKKDYEDTFISAPKNGYMGEIIAQEGEIITRQMPIAIFVSSEDNFFIETSVIESNLPLIQANQKVDIKLDILPGEIIKGKLLSISPEATTSSRMIPIRVELPASLNSKLKPGFSAVCTILIFHKNTIIIPKTAIIKDKSQVYVIDPASKPQARDIEIGYTSKNYVEVKRGLTDNEIIVSNIPEGLKGDIKVKYSAPEEYKPEGSDDKQNDDEKKQ